MKKALAILMILALVGSAAFAEITFGAWGRGLFVPVQNMGAEDEDNSASTGVSWGTPNPRVGMTIKGTSDNAGFQIDWNSDGASFGISDQNKIWVKPVSMVTLSIGRVFDDTLRGNAAFGAWDWVRKYSVVNYIGSEDFTFSRIDTLNQGFVVSVAPMEALYLAMSFNDLASGQKTEDLMGDFQAQAGYTIAGIGQIRVGYKATQINEKAGKAAVAANTTYSLNTSTGAIVGNAASPAVPATDKVVQGTLEAAFKLTAVENLYVDLGIRIPTNTDDAEQAQIKDINLYANYKMDALKIHAIGQYKMIDADGFDGDKLDNGMMVGAGLDYALAGGIGIAADVRYMTGAMAKILNTKGIADKIYADPTYVVTAKDIAAANADDAVTSFFVGVTKGFSNGNVGVGVQMHNAADSGFAVPVRMEYSF